MTGTAGEQTTLSRASDHLGNLANILKDLEGGGTLLHELTQNANDAPADAIRFVASEDELLVWNSADFSDCSRQELRQCPWKVNDGRRSCDLHSFRQVAGRHKAEDDATTGAFGVGFTAVYQVTDHPELVTGQRHLVLDESRAEDDRIQICSGGCRRDHSAPGTTFYLPWAREQTALRRELGASALDDVDIAELTDQMHKAAGSALIFLEHVQLLEVSSPGKSTKVARRRVADRVTLMLDGHESEWLLLEGSAEGAEDLKAHYDQGGSRSPLVQVAVPTNEAIVGRIYADLPTETPTGWGGHVNATFFPRQDRKTVEFDGAGFRGKWNDMLVDTAAKIMSEGLELITETLGHRVAWTYLLSAEQINRSIARAEHPKAFGAFFARAKEAVPGRAITLLTDGRSVVPNGTIVPVNEVEYEARDVLMCLGLLIVDPSIRPQVLQVSRTEYGIHQLSAADVVDALSAAGIVDSWSPTETTDLSNADVESLLRLLNHLQARGKSALLDAGADRVAIVPCVDGSFARADSVSRLDDDDRALFELLAPDLKILDEARLENLCPAMVELCDDITPERAIEIFESDHDALGAGPVEVLDWFDNHRAALHDEEVRARVRALPVFPSTNGGFRPLSELSLASTFEDLLGVADVVDLRQATGHEDLLRLLGAKELDAAEYLIRHVMPRAEAGVLDGELLVQILDIIYGERPHLESSPDARELLSRAPLVRCTDGVARPAVAVHSPNRALALIAPDEPIADMSGLAPHLTDTLYWLGVSRHPNHRVLAQAVERLATDEVDPEPDVVLAILDALPEPHPEPVPPALVALRTAAWLPVEGGGRAVPSDVYAVYQRERFESQGPKLALPRPDQNARASVLRWVGVNAAPTTPMVIAHLRHCARTGQRLSEEVYRALGEAKDSHLVGDLRGEPCIQISPGEFVEPGAVYWTDVGLGRWAHQLAHGHRTYQQFFDLVGVLDAPEPGHVEGILRQISRATGNDKLDDEDRRVVHRCWELLDEQLADPSTGPAALTVLARLRSVRSSADARGMLDKPEMLIFIDGRRLAEKIELISNNLIRRDQTTQRALTAAGVQAAEDLIDTFVDPALASSPAERIRGLILDRRPAIRRLVESHRQDDGTYDVSRLDAVEFREMPGLVIEYRVRFAHRVQITDPEPSEAVFLEDQNQLLVRSQVPSRHLAREVARCIEPEADVSVIAPPLHEILSAPSLGDAMAVLNDYGVRDLDETEWDHVPTQVSDQSVELEDHESQGQDPDELPLQPTTGNVLDDGGSDDGPSHGDGSTTGHGDSHGAHQRGAGGKSSKNPRRSGAGSRRTQMASFVSFGEDDDRPLDESGDEAPERSPVDSAGVRRVLEYERSSGRFPEEQAHNNPGYDVLSKNAEGVVLRRIEIKSIGGAWTSFGVWMSATQLEENRAHPDDFWLYVVEHAEDDDAAVIHRIHNPVGEATKFGFDAGWQALREPDIERDVTGKALINSTRRLLGWAKSDD